MRLGRIMSRDLADYHVPSHKDVVEIDPIANAVFNATAVRVRTLPITPDKLL